MLLRNINICRGLRTKLHNLLNDVKRDVMFLRNALLLKIYNHKNICNDVPEKYVVYCVTPNVPYVAKECLDCDWSVGRYRYTNNAINKLAGAIHYLLIAANLLSVA